VCFSATANFVGSGALGAVGVVTLTKVKHRRELLFAALPTLFAVHQCIEGFVWLGLDGILSPAVAHDMGAAYMLYAQGLLPFLLPLSVLLGARRGRARLMRLKRASSGSASDGRAAARLAFLTACGKHFFKSQRPFHSKRDIAAQSGISLRQPCQARRAGLPTERAARRRALRSPRDQYNY
jgi:hypothetical protein